MTAATEITAIEVAIDDLAPGPSNTHGASTTSFRLPSVRSCDSSEEATSRHCAATTPAVRRAVTEPA